MLDTSFERFIGDIGNPATWPFPVAYRIVNGAGPAEVIGNTPAAQQAQFEKFRDAADELIETGVAGITTTCGFLGLYQPALAEHCSVPVATSSLLQVPMVERLLPKHKRVGILTYDAQALDASLLDALGVATDTPMSGIARGSLFYRWIMQGLPNISKEELLPDLLNAARELQKQHPEVGAIVSECTNLTPFAGEIREETGLPIYDMLTLMHWFKGGILG